MKSESNRIWWPVIIIAGALATWGLFLGIGAFLAPADEYASSDYRKLGVVAITTALFLALWGMVLLIHSRKTRRKDADRDDSSS